MQKKGANISLKGYDDIFSTDQSRAEAQQERVQEIPLSELHPFEGHPFRVVDDEEMMKTAESVRDFGVLTPAIVRPDPYGGYEIISGHRRHRASELAGKETMPVIVRDMDDDAAIILMVDANLQRESILPSERAFAYRMKMDAIKHQGSRADLTSSQFETKLRSDQIVADEAGQSRATVQRYIRLTELIASLSERAADVHAGIIDPSVDNMLKITSDGRKLGLDQRLMNPLLPDDPNSKLNACVGNILRIWQDGQTDRLAIFMALKRTLRPWKHIRRSPRDSVVWKSWASIMRKKLMPVKSFLPPARRQKVLTRFRWAATVVSRWSFPMTASEVSLTSF